MHPFTFDRLDRYTLRRVVGPLAVVLATLLLAQLLERLLRLIDLAATAGAPLASVVVMFVSLVPHYLGLTLPMALAAAVFIAAARMADDNELDVMLAHGRSMTRIAAPCFTLALLLVPFNLYLFAELQPLARYGYHVAVDAALQTGWDAKLEPDRFVDAGGGVTFSAGAIGPDGRELRDVFVVRRGDGVEEVTTAARGRLVAGADGGGLRLQLDDGLTLRQTGDAEVSIARFAANRIDHDLAPKRAAFRARGDSPRERTLPELWRDLKRDGDARAAAEFHGRLAHALVLPLLPLLALPLGMASRRGRRAPGVVFATLALVALDHALQFGQGLAANGHLAAAPAVWTPFVLFALLCVWVFRGSRAWPGDNPVSRAVAAIEARLDGAWARRRAVRAGGVA